jgi:hypothetical protein
MGFPSKYARWSDLEHSRTLMARRLALAARGIRETPYFDEVFTGGMSLGFTADRFQKYQRENVTLDRLCDDIGDLTRETLEALLSTQQLCQRPCQSGRLSRRRFDWLEGVPGKRPKRPFSTPFGATNWRASMDGNRDR